jgi:hypothetical protein
MTRWPGVLYLISLLLSLVAVAVLFLPAPKPIEARQAVRRPAPAAAPQPAEADPTALAIAERQGQRVVFLPQTEMGGAETSDTPPVVLGSARLGRRSWIYVEGGGEAVRYYPGSSVAGWRVDRIGQNFVDFYREGETRRVRLFQNAAPPEQSPVSPEPARPQTPPS